MKMSTVLTLVMGIAIVIAIGKFCEIKSSEKPKTITIIVRKGWCLSEIAEDLGTSIKDLIELNNIKNPDLIYARQRLKVVPYNRNNKITASYYGEAFHGKKMSDKELFDMNDPTIAAEKLLPFGTKVRLTRIDDGKNVVVTVRDRGPYIKERSFDLSKAAAKKLGFVEEGIINCTVKILN